MPSSNTQLWSQWDVNSYTITFAPNGGSVTPTSKTFTINDSISLPTPTRTGYTFSGWKVTEKADVSNWTLNDVYTGTSIPAGKYGNVTLTAQWTVNTYTITVQPIQQQNTQLSSRSHFRARPKQATRSQAGR